MNTTTATTTVVAENAPLGVQLWPTTSPKYADNFTLASVAVVRTESRSFVEWTYRSGATRMFGLGEQVAVQF